MAGRTFGPNKVVAKYHDQELFEKGVFTGAAATEM
jgi:hypothetical protein